MTEIKQPKIRFKGHIDSWEQRKLSDMKDVRDGTHASPKYHSEGYPLVTSKNLKEFGLDMTDVSLISEEDYKAINSRSNVDVGDILFGMIGTIGNPIIVNRSDFAIKNVALIKEGGSIYNSFLLQLLKSPIFERYIKRENAGNTQKFLGLSKIRDFELLCPKDKEQENIGEFFKTLDNLSTLHQQKLEVTKQFKQTMLKKMFPKNGETTPEIRFKGFTDDWKEEKLGNLIKLNKSQEVKRENLTNIRNGYYVLGMRTFSKDGYLDKSKDFWYNLPVEDNPDLFLNIGEFAMIDADMDSELSKIGKVLMNASDEKYLLNSQIRKIKSTQSEHNKFIYPLMSGKKIQKKFKLESSGSIAKHLLDKDVYKQKVLITEDKKEQELIGDFFYQLEKEIYLIEQKLETYKSFKKAMLQKMFI